MALTDTGEGGGVHCRRFSSEKNGVLKAQTFVREEKPHLGSDEENDTSH